MKWPMEVEAWNFGGADFLEGKPKPTRVSMEVIVTN